MKTTLHRKLASDSTYVFVHNDWNSQWFDIQKVEKVKNAKYIGEFSVKNKKGNWANTPVSIFYQEEPHPEGGHYFGLFVQDGKVLITDGQSAADNIWYGVLNPETKEILYSAFRHDYQSHNEIMTDGGPEYIRCSPAPRVAFCIEGEELNIVQLGDKRGPNERHLYL